MKLDDRIDRLLIDISGHGGVVRSAELIARGHSQWTIDAALARGRVLRVRRVWIARPDADPHLHAAARAGVVLSCVTQAERLGLWVFADDAAHVAVHGHRGRIDVIAGTVVHRRTPIVPRNRDDLADPIENVLANIAACQPLENAVAAWSCALRKQLVTPLGLRRLPFTGAARSVLELAMPFADSGLETLVLVRTRRWPVRVLPQVPIAGHDVDFLFGDRLVLQVDGAHHVGPQRTSDIAHDAQLTLLGYHVIRVGYAQVVHHWPEVQAVLMQAIAQGLHEARDDRGAAVS